MPSAAAKQSRKPANSSGRAFVALAAFLVLVVTGCSAELQEGSEGPTIDTAPTAAPKDGANVKHRLVRVKKRIQFSTDVIATSALDKGVTQLQQAGHPGVRVKVVRVTTKNGDVLKRDVVNKFVARQPVDRIVLRGTRVEPKPKPEPASNCDSNYAGACVPIASDVDCGGGEGDGPEYVSGPVRVVGSDVYDLDNDGDGVACDS